MGIVKRLAGKNKHLIDTDNWYGITKNASAEAAVYHYGKSTDYTIHIYDPNGKFIHKIEQVLSHESLHLALISVTRSLKICSALDKLEKWPEYPYSYPQ